MSRSLARSADLRALAGRRHLQSQHLVAAVGIDAFGTKVVLGLVQEATENAKAVSRLLDHLAERGLDFTQPRLYLVDGSRYCAARRPCRFCPALPRAQHP